MKKVLITTIVCFFTIVEIFAQIRQIDKTFNTQIGAGFDQAVAAHAIQTDGKILVAGSFTSYDFLPKNRITRLLEDGSLDASFNVGTGPNADIVCMALQPDGKILIIGGFTLYNGTAVNKIARLNTDGSLDTTFISGTGSSNFYTSLAIQADGKILIGGFFSSYNSITVKNIIRLNSDGSLDTSFNTGTGPSSTVGDIVPKSNGKIVIAGDFQTYNGISRPRIAQLNADGTLDTSFNPGNGPNSFINCMSVQTDGKILIGGSFSTYNFVSRNRIARINSDGTADNSFNPGIGVNDTVESISVQTDGKVILGGSFSQHNNIARNNITRVNSDGTLDTTFNSGTGTNQIVSFITTKPDGKIIIAGDFTAYNETPQGKIAQLQNNGTLDTTFLIANGIDAGADKRITKMALQTDGKILIGFENIATYNGVTVNRLARLNANGTLDTSFNPGTGPSAAVNDIAIQTDGKIIVVGNFSGFNGFARNGIVRLNTDGSLDSSFNTGTSVNFNIYSVDIQTDGKIIIGGGFTSYQGVAQKNIARINPNGTLDTTFDIGAGFEANSTNLYGSSVVFMVTLQPDGKVLVGGNFDTYNGVNTKNLCRLDTDGSLDTTFNAGASTNWPVSGIKIQSDNKIYITGTFTTYQGTARKGIARLNANGTLDTAFVPLGLFNPNTGTNFDGYIHDIEIQSDEKIIIVGDFYSYGGAPVFNIARLENNGVLDTTFNAPVGVFDPIFNNTYVVDIIIQPDGKTLISGSFKLYNNVTVGNITRIFTDDDLLATPELKKERFKLYPNPASHTVYFSNILTEIQIYDLQGKLIKVSSTSNSLNVDSLTAGIYVLVGFTIEGEKVSCKLIKSNK
ncbi:MAG: T9SS type A sorting domain-containing protein [Cyclobacteriaceae bacterium]|nr:T9SS type A sorting domain-containing protein [Cyclobacteriaceae bacterium]